MEETDGERLHWVEAHDSWHSRKEHLEIRCEICYACREGGPLMWMMPLHLQVYQKSDYDDDIVGYKKSWPIAQTQIRLFLKKQFDQGLPCFVILRNILWILPWKPILYLRKKKGSKFNFYGKYCCSHLPLDHIALKPLAALVDVETNLKNSLPLIAWNVVPLKSAEPNPSSPVWTFVPASFTPSYIWKYEITNNVDVCHKKTQIYQGISSVCSDQRGGHGVRTPPPPPPPEKS